MTTINSDGKPGYVYNQDDDTWYPLLGIATQTLDGLTDVIITSASSGQALVYNGTNWVNASAGAGSVTSVGLSMPTGFSVSGSPVTSSGTLAVSTTLNGSIQGNGSGFTAISPLLKTEAF